MCGRAQNLSATPEVRSTPAVRYSPRSAAPRSLPSHVELGIVGDGHRDLAIAVHYGGAPGKVLKPQSTQLWCSRLLVFVKNGHGTHTRLAT